MDLHRVDRYDADVDRVFAMLSDETFLREKFAAMSQPDVEILELGPVGDVFRIKTRRSVEMELPGFARKFMAPRNPVTQTDEWGPLLDGTRRGSWRVESRGVPVTVAGTIRLEPAGAGATNTIDGTAKSSVPLVGGRLAGLVGDLANRTMEQEYAFGRRWLAEHG